MIAAFFFILCRTFLLLGVEITYDHVLRFVSTVFLVISHLIPLKDKSLFWSALDSADEVIAERLEDLPRPKPTRRAHAAELVRLTSSMALLAPSCSW